MKLMVDIGDNGALWGTVSYEDDLFVDRDNTEEGLINKMKSVIKTFLDLDVEFEINYL